MTCKGFPRYWPFCEGKLLVTGWFPSHRRQWYGSLMFPLVSASTNCSRKLRGRRIKMSWHSFDVPVMLHPHIHILQGCSALVLGKIYEHDDIIKWKPYPRHSPFVWGNRRSPVNSPHKGQWRGALMFSVIYAWINDWVNNGEAGDWDAIALIMTSL